MKVLIACEESQTVCKAFRKRGHEAYSCDIQDCSGGRPEWHIKGDVLPLLSQDWDLIIAHPPCTDLAVSGARWFEEKRKTGQQQKSVEFFMRFTETCCEKVAIENPVGIMSSYYRKPDQIIQPYMFGEPYEKKTCLWLKNLPKLVPTEIVEPPERVKYESGRTLPKWYAECWHLSPEERSRIRSKTFDGIAKAMAEQWG
ncbi:MAG: hypothetical protein II008_11425 [Oscillospiraceae bacterium]|nr:hypothetical protein [Oscillospiraceae bacterium]